MGVEDAGRRLPLCLGLICKYVNMAQRMLQRTRPAELDDAAGYAIPTTRGRRGTPTIPGGQVETHRMRLLYGESQVTVTLVVEKSLNGFLGAWRENNTLNIPVPQCASGLTDNGHAVQQGKTGQNPTTQAPASPRNRHRSVGLLADARSPAKPSLRPRRRNAKVYVGGKPTTATSERRGVRRGAYDQDVGTPRCT